MVLAGRYITFISIFPPLDPRVVCYRRDAVPARITLGVTTLLTMTTQLSSSRSSSMKVSYPKALDVWYAFCMIIVFGALLEYTVVNVLSRREKGMRLARARRQQEESTGI